MTSLMRLVWATERLPSQPVDFVPAAAHERAEAGPENRTHLPGVTS